MPRLLSHKIVLAMILKGCVQEFMDCPVYEIAHQYIEGEPLVMKVGIHKDDTAPSPNTIRGLPTEDTSTAEGLVKYDIRFLVVTPESQGCMEMIINVESQQDFAPGYPLLHRAIYYCSRLISSQYGSEFTHAQYQKIKKVYSIWICSHPDTMHQNSITRYRMTEDPLVGNVQEDLRHYDLLQAIIVGLGKATVTPANDTLAFLNLLLSDKESPAEKKKILEKDFGIPMSEEMEKEVELMGSLSYGIRKEAFEEGREKEARDIVLNLHQMGIPIEKIAQAVRYPEEKIAEWLHASTNTTQ